MPPCLTDASSRHKELLVDLISGVHFLNLTDLDLVLQQLEVATTVIAERMAVATHKRPSLGLAHSRAL